MSNSHPSLKEETRQSPVAILIILQRLFLMIIKSAWPVFVFYFINPQSKIEYFMTLIAIGAVALSTIGSLISYFTFYFRLEETELVMRSGLLNKTFRTIPFDRIQTISFTQNILHRIFNVVQLDLDTAGSSGNELAIKALSHADANAIKSFILERKEALPSQLEENDLPQSIISEKPGKTLLHLSIKDLLKIGVSQNHLRTVGIMLAFFIGLSQYAEELLSKEKEEAIWLFLLGSVIIITMLIVLLFVGAFFLSLINTVLRYYDLRLLSSSGGYTITSGLFTKTEQSAQHQKIQLLEWRNNPIKRIFGIYTLYLKQAASAALKKKSTLVVPGCYLPQIEAVRDSYFSDFNKNDFKEYAISPLVVGRIVLYLGVVPTLIFFLPNIIKTWWALLILGWIPVVWMLAQLYYKKWRYAISPKGVYLTKGFIGQRAAILRWYKVQSVTLKQSPFQRRKALATLNFSTAGGNLTLPYIPLAQAKELKDYVLYVVERSKEDWM